MICGVCGEVTVREFSTIAQDGFIVCSICSQEADKALEAERDELLRISSEKWRALAPAAKYERETFISQLFKYPQDVVSLCMRYALATRDVNRWLDTLNDSTASAVLKDAVRQKLRDTSAEYTVLCTQLEHIERNLDAALAR